MYVFFSPLEFARLQALPIHTHRMSRSGPRHHLHHASASGCHTLGRSSFFTFERKLACLCLSQSSLFKPHLIVSPSFHPNLSSPWNTSVAMFRRRPHLLHPPFVKNRSIGPYPVHRVIHAPVLSLLPLSSILLPPVPLSCC